MHISEGVLSFPVIGVGYLLAATGLMVGLRRLEDKEIVKTAVLSAAFFIASLIHVPVGPGNIHLVLNGLLGLLLGPAVFCAIFVALLTQTVVFQFGGLTTLGVNACVMALPALLCHVLFSRFLNDKRFPLEVIGVLTGVLSVGLSAVLLSAALIFSGEQFGSAAWVIFVAHVPVIIIDGLITAAALRFIHKVKPEMLCVRSL